MASDDTVFYVVRKGGTEQYFKSLAQLDEALKRSMAVGNCMFEVEDIEKHSVRRVALTPTAREYNRRCKDGK